MKKVLLIGWIVLLIGLMSFATVAFCAPIEVTNKASSSGDDPLFEKGDDSIDDPTAAAEAQRENEKALSKTTTDAQTGKVVDMKLTEPILLANDEILHGDLGDQTE